MSSTYIDGDGLGPERVEYAALVNSRVPALAQEPLERVLERPEVRNLRLHFGESRSCDSIDFRAGRIVGPLGKREKTAHRFQREAEFASLADEGQTLKMNDVVDAVSPRATSRLRQYPDLLVIADGHNLAAGQLGQIPDRKAFGQAREPIASVDPIGGSGLGVVKAERAP